MSCAAQKPEKQRASPINSPQEGTIHVGRLKSVIPSNPHVLAPARDFLAMQGRFFPHFNPFAIQVLFGIMLVLAKTRFSLQ
jgi:hypothetical protein